MYNKFQLAFKYLQYYGAAANGSGHGVHSPFVFEFITKVLNDKRFFYAYDRVERLRAHVLLNDEKIEVQDYGAGSAVMASRNRKVKDIARWSLKSAKYARLLFRMVNYYQPQTVVELGTALGITTAYLASANTSAQVYTLEGAPAIAALARQHFAQLRLSNIHLTVGNFDDTLRTVLAKAGKADFAFIDGNHRMEPTLRYFNWLLPYVQPGSLFVFDDIHWSAEMEAAWRVIRSHPLVTCSIDLFFIGVVFFTPGFKEKQHFSIRF
ncbi:class I SAM-dependent methyltransferase [Agriterribacter sp.]|uniref:O-methyltransferase n=1 Tax=Agriterribacter sp. TaxID=2821509 RepID=UPI002C756B45|nr:class I SAM-dependent methyltransferase [Agriterribacter sp.]HRO45215.1 class I SAM-dependent methyltransferase [Agriterribacter sp.]HRQ16818.1 class I SAM-dependent methyltransferase [Agriterribacter sp.]